MKKIFEHTHALTPHVVTQKELGPRRLEMVRHQIATAQSSSKQSLMQPREAKPSLQSRSANVIYYTLIATACCHLLHRLQQLLQLASPRQPPGFSWYLTILFQIINLKSLNQNYIMRFIILLDCFGEKKKILKLIRSQKYRMDIHMTKILFNRNLIRT